MVQPLTKRKRADGLVYRRRPEVEAELERLAGVDPLEIHAAARSAQARSNSAVSSEALVHVLRRAVREGTTQRPGLEGLISVLVDRTESIVGHHIYFPVDSLQRKEILGEVVDGLIDAILAPNDLADYAEVNFNDWLAHKRLTALRKHERRAARAERARAEIQSEQDDSARRERREPADLIGWHTNPPLPIGIDKGRFKEADRRRIAAAMQQAELPAEVLEAFLLREFWEVPINSSDQEKHTLVRHFGKSERTIRNWLRRAEDSFERLKGKTSEARKNDATQCGRGAPRLSS
jgi:hypothetical protein